ncbi:MAG: hypothetical protein QOF58_739 [Pseudonocardiales bacterium]|nr:hypothetical protein [Pseudonocardiales bacterium]
MLYPLSYEGARAGAARERSRETGRTKIIFSAACLMARSGGYRSGLNSTGAGRGALRPHRPESRRRLSLGYHADGAGGGLTGGRSLQVIRFGMSHAGSQVDWVGSPK